MKLRKIDHMQSPSETEKPTRNVYRLTVLRRRSSGRINARCCFNCTASIIGIDYGRNDGGHFDAYVALLGDARNDPECRTPATNLVEQVLYPFSWRETFHEE